MADETLADVIWHPIHSLSLGGLGWRNEDREQPLDRFPTSLKGLISPELWKLGCWSAGIYADFLGPPTELFVRWTMEEPQNPQADAFMAACARSGLDCYGRDHAGRWRWVGSKEAWREPSCDGRLHRLPLDGAARTYRVYLPLMRRVLSCEIGCRQPLSPVAADGRRPIAYYGTSIVHGAGVGRPGMPHAAQLGRALDREVFNLGVCGRAHCEIAIAEALGRLDPLIYLIDVLPNNTVENLGQRLPPFLRCLRQLRPDTPILCIGDRVFGDATFMPQRGQDFVAKNRRLQEIIDSLGQEGLSGLHLAVHADWFGSDGGSDGEGTADASHPNDLGAWRMAQQLTPVVQGLCENR